MYVMVDPLCHAEHRSGMAVWYPVYATFDSLSEMLLLQVSAKSAS